jgi:hypothetical protein
MSSGVTSVRLRIFKSLIVARMAFSASLLTAGVKLQNIVCEGGPLRECGRKRHAQRKLMVNKDFALTGSGAYPCDNCDGDRFPSSGNPVSTTFH